MRSRIWAGLDVGAETTTICVINDDGEVLQQTKCSSSLETVDKEIRWLRRRRRATLAMEAGSGFHLAHGLRSRGYVIDLYEARQLSKFLRVRRHKTDASDAAGIADVGRLGRTIVSKVHLRSLESQELLSRLTIRRQLVRQRVAVVSLLCRQLELYGGRISHVSRSSKFTGQVEAELTKLFGKKSTPLTRELRHLLGHYDALLNHERLVNRELSRCAMEHQVCHNLMTIPGVGWLAARDPRLGTTRR